ncbi:Protein kinase domain [Dillenia turbinata]|uniref:Protein kinase domain n=1 Tax=Dillenia turbinata TaxID=194707 RepID=A0AAN8YXH3_9MAGN
MNAAKSQFLSLDSDKWVKGKIVGKGSFGTVHLGMNKLTGGLFVVKSADSKAGLKSLQNEANILENLNSRYIVRSLGKSTSTESSKGEPKMCLFMEYMAGGSISDVADKFGGILDEQVIRLYTKNILYGLDYLHKKGIVHRDIKCKNVLLDSLGNAKLADFGSAITLNGENPYTGLVGFDKESICGTPLWMAPEVLRNEGIDFASDIWSLGCTVVEMARGRPPWSESISNPFSAVMRIACGNEIPKFPKNLSKEGMDFLIKCLDRNPRNRWTAEELLCHPFVSSDDATPNVGMECYGRSPTSILDISQCEVDCNSRILELGKKIPFSARCCEETIIGREIERECEWITVR